MATTDPNEPQPGEEGTGRSESEPRRHHGVSPVVAGGGRRKLGAIAGFLMIVLVVGFLFVTAGKSGNPASSGKPMPTLANATGLPAAPPPLPPLSPDQVQAGFPPPPVPGQKPNTTNAQTANEEARRRAPMLVYDISGTGDQTMPKPSSTGDMQSAITAQLLKATMTNAALAGAEDEGKAGTPAERYADRTLAFAKSSSDQQVPEATARIISLDNRIAQGKMLAATLETAVNSDLPGKLRAVVSSDVWSEDGTRRLIVRGSRMIGDYRSGAVRGQTRVFVIWTRLLQPDGTDVAIGSPGTDDLGRAGLTGTIDRHFTERFGAAVLLSVIGSATTATQGGNTFVINTSQGFGEVAQESLKDSINIPPTISIDQGALVQVFVARDLVFGPPAAAVAR